MGAWIETFQRAIKAIYSWSHPTWVRGLKLVRVSLLSPSRESHPTWVRGLKLVLMLMRANLLVAPYVGAWIETVLGRALKRYFGVAPYVGAWIETRQTSQNVCQSDVAPYVGAWIETVSDPYTGESAMSHPTWVRGLKLYGLSYVGQSGGRTLRGCVD